MYQYKQSDYTVTNNVKSNNPKKNTDNIKTYIYILLFKLMNNKFGLGADSELLKLLT